MKILWTILFGFTLATGFAYAGSAAAEAPRPVTQPAIHAADLNPQWIAEGERRFRINCGRCHQSPHKFQPRVMATAVRHMRVRGMLTDDDMKYVLYYVTH
jgi:mono/diheme cytochrome c family protein